MGKILGIDLGTNSIGWATVNRNEEDNSYSLLHRGVHIFQEGVAREKGAEKPAVQDRTAARASRRHYFRKRLRKIELLKVLVKEGLCPPLSPDDLKAWRQEGRYPMYEEFLKWQRTSEANEKNPYHDRYVCLNTKLDLSKREDRYTLGRALYHLNQRRGFLSNRKESAGDDESGQVKQEISSLTRQMENAGCKYLGEYFYHCYGNEKIRCRHTARNEHFLAEFNAICKQQSLQEPLVKALHRAIFYQRPLKSQKGSVGHCTFEKDKPCCPVSHPRYEEFRMWQFLNSVRVSYLQEAFRPLTPEEKGKALPLFFRKSKPDFIFEEIAKAIAGKGNYAFKDDERSLAYKFNYKMDYPVSACPVIASILSAIGLKDFDDWENVLCSIYTKAEGKDHNQIVNDVWHALFNFDDENRLVVWLQDALQLEEDKGKGLAKARFPQGYASLSLKAIGKILPLLRQGFIYSDAVFLANLSEVLPAGISAEKEREIRENVAVLLEDFESNPLNQGASMYKTLSDYLIGTADGVRIDKLYHPSMIELYSKALPDAEGKVRLGSPRTDAFRNPMAMRALFRLRALINCLLDEGKIDPDTQINIEFARGLNDANKRRAIEEYQREQEKQRKADRDRIVEHFREASGNEVEPSDEDLLKYRLWEEQKHVCPYTGKEIGLSDFLGPDPRFDIEHTVPRSRGGDNSAMNNTLCDSHFNRFEKKACLPAELPNYEAILERVANWKEQIESLDKQLSGWKRRKKAASTKAEKDNAIRRIHLLSMKRDYWRGKYERFTMTNVPENFSNRQGIDIGIIGKYARLYLKTVFDRIYVVKGATTSDFRKAWGLQSEYVKKERVNHAHHCIDAVTIACINKKEYDDWKHYQERNDDYRYARAGKPVLPKPWKTFTQDVLAIPDGLIVSHYTADNMPKRSRKKVRVRGVIQRNAKGEALFSQGDTARGLLHKDTFYGAIRRGDEIKYVVRKSLDGMDEKDIKNIVDDVVREKVQAAVARAGNLKNAVNEGIWMNEEKRIPIKKVRVFTPNVTAPVHLKAQRDASEKEYKRSYHVMNDGNYCMAIYDGSVKPSFKIFSLLDAAKNFKEMGSEKNWIPHTDAKGVPLRCVLKPGTLILFYENGPEELHNCSQEDLVKRLYKVTGLSTMVIKQGIRRYEYGMLTLKYHQEARPTSELQIKKGCWSINEAYRPIISIQHTQAHFLVQGKGFEVTTSGVIRLKNDSND